MEHVDTLGPLRIAAYTARTDAGWLGVSMLARAGEDPLGHWTEGPLASRSQALEAARRKARTAGLRLLLGAFLCQ